MKLDLRPLLAEKTDEELMEFIGSALEKRMPHYSKARHIFCAEELEDKQQIRRSVDALRLQLNIEKIDNERKTDSNQGRW